MRWQEFMKSVPLFGSNEQPAPACPGRREPPGAGPRSSCSCPGPMTATWCSLYRKQSASGGSQFTVLSSPPMVFVVDGDSLRHHSPAKQRGREDCIQHAGPPRRRLYPPHLHPRYAAEAGRGSPGHGRPHGASHVKAEEKTDRRRKSPVRHAFVRYFVLARGSRYGSRCGS